MEGNEGDRGHGTVRPFEDEDRPRPELPATYDHLVQRQTSHLTPSDGVTCPPMAVQQSIGSVALTDCRNVHVGTKLKGDSVTIKRIDANHVTIYQNVGRPHGKTQFTFDDPGKNKNQIGHFEKASCRTRVIFCLVYAAAVTSTITALVVALNGQGTPAGGNATVRPSPSTTVRPPKDWFVNVSEWSDQDTPVSRKYQSDTKRLLAVDDTGGGSCQDVQACKNLLRQLQKSPYQVNNTNYNYLIGGDGRVYEARGNNLEADPHNDYSDNVVKVAFIGEYRLDRTLSPVQTEVLQLLIAGLQEENQLTDSYKVVPQCCRNMPRETGPSPAVIRYLYRHYADHWNNDRKCPCVNDSVNQTTTTPTPSAVTTATNETLTTKFL